MRILGIDVGAKGALALICTTACTLALFDMPTEIATGGKSVTSPLGVAQAIQAAQADAIFIEHVTSSPQAGVTSSFQFGRAYGVVPGRRGRDRRAAPPDPPSGLENEAERAGGQAPVNDAGHSALSMRLR